MAGKKKEVVTEEEIQYGSMLKGILAAVKNPYATIASQGIVGGDILFYSDSGNYVLNALISGDMLNGGFPSGKVVALAGEKGSGKTFVLTKAIKKFLDADPERELVLFESEGAITQNMLIDRGIDMDRVSVFPISTVEELRSQALLALNFIQSKTPKGKYAKVMFALDSLGMLGTEWELNMAVSGDSKADMGKRANLIKSVFRTITLKLGIMQIPMIITNHTYSTMNNAGTKMGGGTGLEFAASIIIFLSKTKDKEDTGEKKSDGKAIKDLVGNIVYFRVEKGRFTVEGSTAPIPLSFKTGITQYSGILDLLIKAKVMEKSGAWISYNGKNIAQGDKAFYKRVEEFVTEDVLKELIPYVMNTFMYGEHGEVDQVEETPDEPAGE